MFDPRSVTANCAAGDPGLAAYGSATVPGWGEYSWGKEKGNEGATKGLSASESLARKAEAIKEAQAAEAAFDAAEQRAEEAEEALEAAKATGDQAQIDEAKAQLEAAEKEAIDAATKALEAAENAYHDPNEADQYAQTTQEPSECEMALQAAREFLWECHRTSWKSYACQALQAAMTGCPDPAYIYVDPEQGYSCAPTFDPEALKNAWVERCERLKRPGPDGNPCAPPTVNERGTQIEGSIPDICRDPRVYIDPHSEDCAQPLTIQPFGTPDIQQLMVWGLNKLGGPVVVLPPKGDPEPPTPGPEPKPGPIN
jgi:hypothetical protein